MKGALLFLSVWGFAMGSAHAQACLHGPNESAEQAARKREALTATRNINNIQANQPGNRIKQFLSYEQLDTSPFSSQMRKSTNETVKSISLTPGTDILLNWQLTLDVTPQGYWFMIKDKSDPCAFAYVSNQQGVIYNAEVIR
jgi:hypothetical protein